VRARKRLNAATGVLVAALLASCASFDPHNILGRRAAEYSSRNDDGFVREPDAAERRELRRRNVELVWTTIRDRYYRADLNGVDWHAARAKWEPLIVDAPSEDEYWLRLDRLAGELADAHTRVESPTQVEARRRQRVRSLGLGLRDVEDRLLVISVSADADAFFAGIRPGMTITAIGGAPALERWREWIANARPSSTVQATRGEAARRLNELARSNERGVDIEFERFDGSRERAPLKPRDIATRASVAHRVLPSGLGYVRLSAFSETLRSDLFSAIAALKDAPGLILDLRGNRGGSSFLAQSLVGAFFTERTVIGKAITRTERPVSLAFGAFTVAALDRVVPGRNDAYTGKLVVLIDNDSASASEMVASALQQTGRAHVLGEISCGCLLAFLGYASLNGGGELAYSEIGYVDNDGKYVEKQGVTPNSHVERSQDDVRSGRDRALEAAVAHLRGR
jgi:carboxyl-terminal processing protease